MKYAIKSIYLQLETGLIINTTVRSPKLTYKAWRLLWDKFVKLSEDTNIEINPDIMKVNKGVANEMGNKVSVSTVSDHFEKLDQIWTDTELAGLIKEFDKDRPHSFIYWRQYMNRVSLLLHFLRAESTEKWKVYLSAFADMLSWLFTNLQITLNGGQYT